MRRQTISHSLKLHGSHLPDLCQPFTRTNHLHADATSYNTLLTDRTDHLTMMKLARKLTVPIFYLISYPIPDAKARRFAVQRSTCSLPGPSYSEPRFRYNTRNCGCSHCFNKVLRLNFIKQHFPSEGHFAK